MFIVGIILAALLNAVIGLLWFHSSVFGKEWANSKDQSLEDRVYSKDSYLVIAINSFLSSFAIYFIMSMVAITKFSDAVTIGVLVWTAAVAVDILNIGFNRKSSKTLMIEAAYQFISFAAMSFLLKFFI